MLAGQRELNSRLGTATDPLHQPDWLARLTRPRRAGSPRGAAARLGMKRTTLLSLMKRLGVTRPATA